MRPPYKALQTIIFLIFTVSSANSHAVLIDFKAFPDGSLSFGVISNQYEELGVIFSGIGNHNVIKAALTLGSGNVDGISHSINNSPFGRHGLRASFLRPITSFSVDLFSWRVGTGARVIAYDANGSPIFDQLNQSNSFFKGKIEKTFLTQVTRLDFLSEDPGTISVGVTNLEYKQVIEPSSLTLFLTIILVASMFRRSSHI